MLVVSLFIFLLPVQYIFLNFN